tara:strand:+ start:2057 stop:2689 length:633 start_codon:yes stop_codon:yes gene_type:complete
VQKRKITKSAVTNIFRFVSCHKPDPITVEGYNEFIACHYFEFSTQVIDFEAQPQRFAFPQENSNRPLIYTPDFLVRLHDRKEVYFEIKPHSITLTDKFRQKWQLLQRAFGDRALSLELVTDRQLMRGQMAENLKLVHRYMTRESVTEEQALIISLLAGGPQSLNDISIEIQISENFTKELLLNLVAKKLVSFPLYAELNSGTVFVRVNHG